jgi:membrane protein DedA with SNARE-associated domain/rhodanese-related sulfurtransferase
MNDALDFLARHGTTLLFAVVFIEQLGAPIPGEPFLLAAGALAGSGKLNLAAVIVTGTMASLLADAIWFYVGRIRGIRILNLLCRISLEPDSCVRRTEDVFSRHGMRAVVFGKFVPGLSTVMPPLAGIFGVRLRRFLAYDGLSSLLFAGGYILVGYFFSDQLQPVLEALGRLGRGAVALVIGLIALYIAFKVVQRQRFIRKLRIARISVDDLRRMQEANENIFIVDLRSETDLQLNPHLISGAIHLSPKDVETRHVEIPRDRDVVLYCSCPNEATAARVALLLHKRGITRVRPLAGGIDAWRERQYPLEPYAAAVQENAAQQPA